jgi:hypothetical protein
MVFAVSASFALLAIATVRRHAAPAGMRAAAHLRLSH